MDETFFSRIASEAENENLRFIVVGGHAVNAYGYHRTTIDWDILIEETSLKTWRTFWEHRGYSCVHATEAFFQFRSSSSEPLYPVDLMIVEEATFNKLWAQRQQKQIGDALLNVPDPLHIIALKLHALKNEARAKQGKDLPDIIGLIRNCNIDIKGSEFEQVIEQFGNESIKRDIQEKL